MSVCAVAGEGAFVIQEEPCAQGLLKSRVHFLLGSSPRRSAGPFRPLGALPEIMGIRLEDEHLLINIQDKVMHKQTFL